MLAPAKSVWRRGTAVALWALSLVLSLASPAAAAGKPSGRLLAAGNNRILILDQDFQVVWQHPTALTHDAWMLPSGNVLYADGAAVTEITPEKKVVFQYKAAEQKGGGTFSCQRLTNGVTLVGENSTGRVLEVDAQGKILFALPTLPMKPGNHHNLRMTRKLANGNYLVCHSGANLVKEYSPKGEVVLEIKTPALAFAAIRTPAGTTLVASLAQIIEYDAAGKSVWQFTNQEIPGVTISNMTGLHLLPDGSVVTGCYRAYDKSGEGCGLLQISRGKQLAWRYANPKADGTMMSVQLLDPQGQALPGPCLR